MRDLYRHRCKCLKTSATGSKREINVVTVKSRYRVGIPTDGVDDPTMARQKKAIGYS